MDVVECCYFVFLFKLKPAYEMRISDWSSDVCSSDLREHLIRTGSVVLHELYFENLGGSGEAAATEREAIAQAFGSFEDWEREFRRIGAGLGGGSGRACERRIGQACGSHCRCRG